MRTETGHLAYLDGWRGIAISLVLIGHFGFDEIWPKTSLFGVEFFFVLSGRLMTEILFVRRTALKTFFARRFSRVYPGLLAFVVITTIALQGTPYAHGIVAAALALTFTLNYAMIYTHPVAALDHLWSLCVEEHAYLLLAGMALLSRRWAFSIGLPVAAIGIATMANGIVRADLLGQSFLHVYWRSDVAIAGIFISGALWLVFRDRSAPAWLSPSMLVAAIGCKFLPWELAAFGLSTVFLAISVVTLDRAAAPMLGVLSNPVATLMGLWSYSIYLWQQPFYKMHRDALAPTPGLLIGVFVCAIASFYLVERPSREAINKRIGHRGLTEGPASTG